MYGFREEYRTISDEKLVQALRASNAQFAEKKSLLRKLLACDKGGTARSFKENYMTFLGYIESTDRLIDALGSGDVEVSFAWKE